MPSPIGHSIAGAIAAWTADLAPGDRTWRSAPAGASWYRRAGDGLTLICAGLGALADIDLLSPTTAHRAYTHSIGAIILITIIAAAVTGWVTRRAGPGKAGLNTGAPKAARKTFNAEAAEPAEDMNRRCPADSSGSASYVLRIAVMCGAAYATHVLLDWAAVDDTFPYGIRALWPFSDAWYISGWNLFPGTARRHVLSHTSLLQNVHAIAMEIAILIPLAWAVWLARSRALRRWSSRPGAERAARARE